MCNFTKGPWIGKENGKWFSGDDSWDIENYDCDSYSWVEVGCKGGTVAIIPVKGWNDKKMEANAHLIAAAPEMYDELQEVSNWLNSQLGMGEWHKDIEKLLAKARGENV